MDGQQLSTLEALRRKATNGQWETVGGFIGIRQQFGGGRTLGRFVTDGRDLEEDRTNAELVVYAINFLPDLLASARDLERWKAWMLMVCRRLGPGASDVGCDQEIARAMDAARDPDGFKAHCEKRLAVAYGRARESGQEAARLRVENESLTKEIAALRSVIDNTMYRDEDGNVYTTWSQQMDIRSLLPKEGDLLAALDRALADADGGPATNGGV